MAINHRVLDLSALIKDDQGAIAHRRISPTRLASHKRALAAGVLTRPLVLHAGEDISHWFDPDTEEVQHCHLSFTIR